jgi:DNA-binding CsgD family transcriptional regulator
MPASGAPYNPGMLLGRDRERGALDTAMASARTGRSAVLALVGEAGIGKTALLDYAAEHAEGMRILRAQGVESEMNLPFSGLFELLRPTLHLLERIPKPRAAALESALALRPGTSGERFAVGAATLSLLAVFAEEAPALLLVDDAHLLDGSTAEALRFALRRLLAEPLAAVLAVREDEASLLDDAELPTLHIGGLDHEAAAQLLVGAAPETSARLFRATAGNPLALTELARDTSRLGLSAIDAPIPVPAKVSQAFARRGEALAPSTRRLLVLVAADDAGHVPTLERAAQSLNLDLSGLGAAEAAGLIRLVAGVVAFRHPLARAAIYSTSLPEHRRDAHRALAGALPDRDADRRAWHLAAAAIGTDESASSALEQAGTRARQRSAYAVSSAAFERSAQLAADDEHRGRLLTAAAEAAWLAGFADGAVELLEEARALVTDDERIVQIDSLRGHIATRRGPVMEGHGILVAAADRVSATDPDLAISLLADAVDACFFAGDVAEITRTARKLADLVTPTVSTRARFLASMATGMALVFTADSRAGIGSIREAMALVEENNDLRSETGLLPWLVAGPLWLRESGPIRALVGEAIDTARARAALGILPWLLNRVGRDHAASDDWSTAAVEYDESARLARETGQHTERAAALAGLAWLEARQGRETDCRTHAAEARAICAELGIHTFEIWAIRALGELELGLGRAATALDHLEECTRRLGDLGIQDVDLSPAAELVDAYLRMGRTADAARVADQLDVDARRKGQPWPLARATRCRALLAPDGDFEELFREAVTLHAQTPDVFELGITRFSFGARLRRARRRADARDELRAALEIFDRLGAAPWAEMARVELLATGETARRRDRSALETLTPQELHIAQVLAAGKTTREAAAALFLSPKTIEYHLRSVYGKLSINSRTDLAAAVAADQSIMARQRHGS